MPSNKITTTLRLDEETHKALSEIADKEVRSVNNLIEYALKKFLEEYQAKEKGQS